MILHFQVIGSLLILLALIHVRFPGYFKWKEEFRSVGLINRQMMYIHTLFIAVVVFLMGVLFISSSEELITSSLGKRICFGLGLFWLLRLIVQFWGYSSDLWRGKKFETIMHLVFSGLWVYFIVVFFSGALLD
jgi:hypothetical protein